MYMTDKTGTFVKGNIGENAIIYQRFKRKPIYEEGLFGHHEQPFTF